MRKKIRFCTRKNVAKNIGAMVIKKLAKSYQRKNVIGLLKRFLVLQKVALIFEKLSLILQKVAFVLEKILSFYKQNHYK